MLLGAKDHLDRLLVEKYALEQVDNHTEKESKYSPDEVYAVMTTASYNAINYFKLSQRLKITCNPVTAMSAKYVSIPLKKKMIA